jgi:TPR repeat protein
MMRRSVSLGLAILALACLAFGDSGGSGFDELQARAEKGEAVAQFLLGRAYLLATDGVKKDEAAAAVWFKKAAEKGDESAQNYLGLMYEKGRGGLTQDVEKAMYWYRKAADKGYASAQNNLAVIYLGSNPDLRNPRAALDYAQKAATSFKNNPIFLSTLAAAYYAEGQFENAVATQQRVIALVPPDKKDEYSARLNMYMRTLEASKLEVKPRSTFPDR